MPHIGTRASAEFISQWWYDHPFAAAPAGWRKLGAGSFRVVYLNEAENVVYKVEGQPDEDMAWTNRQELRVARALRKRNLNNIYIPLTSGFTLKSGELVIAMEYIKGSVGNRYRHSERRGKVFQARKELSDLNFEDMHWNNYRWIKTPVLKIVPIDMASPRRSKYDADDRIWC